MTATKRLTVEIDDTLAYALALQAERDGCGLETLLARALAEHATPAVRCLLAETGAGDLVEPEDVGAWLAARQKLG